MSKDTLKLKEAHALPPRTKVQGIRAIFFMSSLFLDLIGFIVLVYGLIYLNIGLAYLSLRLELMEKELKNKKKS